MTNVLLEKKGHIAIATINRPKALNALNSDVLTDLGELVDIEKEKVRLAAEIERVSGEIERAKGKLANQNFVNRAPKKLVEDEQEKVKKYEAMKAKLEAQLAEL